MVGAGGATLGGEDSGFVGLEGVTGSVDSDSNGLTIEGSHHGGVVTRDVLVSCSVNLAFGCRVLAGTVFTGVRV